MSDIVINEIVVNLTKKTLTIDGVTHEFRERRTLLHLARVGDICINQHGEYVQIEEIIPSTLYSHKYVRRNGEPVYVNKRGEYWPGYHPFNLVHWEPLEPENTAGWAWQIMQTGAMVIYTKEHFPDTIYYVDLSSKDTIKQKMLSVKTTVVCGNTKAEWLDYAERDGWQGFWREASEPHDLMAVGQRDVT